MANAFNKWIMSRICARWEPYVQSPDKLNVIVTLWRCTGEYWLHVSAGCNDDNQILFLWISFGVDQIAIKCEVFINFNIHLIICTKVIIVVYSVHILYVNKTIGTDRYRKANSLSSQNKINLVLTGLIAKALSAIVRNYIFTRASTSGEGEE